MIAIKARTIIVKKKPGNAIVGIPAPPFTQ